jgi:hypothetical protein
MKKVFVILIMVVFGTSLFGMVKKDSNYVKAIIKTQDDQFDCYIKSKGSYGGKIKYKTSYQDRRKQKIHCNDVLSIHWKDFYFDRVEHEGKVYIMKRLCLGKVALYERIKEEDNPPMYNAATGTTQSIGKDKRTILYIQKQAKVYRLCKADAAELFVDLFSDKPEIVSQLKNLDPKSKNFKVELSQIIKNYNQL